MCNANPTPYDLAAKVQYKLSITVVCRHHVPRASQALARLQCTLPSRQAPGAVVEVQAPCRALQGWLNLVHTSTMACERLESRTRTTVAIATSFTLLIQRPNMALNRADFGEPVQNQERFLFHGQSASGYAKQHVGNVYNSMLVEAFRASQCASKTRLRVYIYCPQTAFRRDAPRISAEQAILKSRRLWTHASLATPAPSRRRQGLQRR